MVDAGHARVKKVVLMRKKVVETLAGMEKLAYLCTRKRETGSLNLSGLSLTLAPLAGEAVSDARLPRELYREAFFEMMTNETK